MQLRKKLFRIATITTLIVILFIFNYPYQANAGRTQFLVSPVQAGPVNAQTFIPGEIVMRVKDGVEFDNLTDLLGDSVGDTSEIVKIRSILDSGIQIWAVPAGSEENIINTLRSDTRVDFAEYNYIYNASVVPDDKLLKNQWALGKINAYAAWDLTQGDEQIVIAVIDTGIDETHPDLINKLVPGYDVIDQDDDPHDLHGHGTHVAGIAAASSNNGIGIAGISWGARIMPVRVLDYYGKGTSAQITEGIIWAAEHGGKIINLSLGGEDYSEAMQFAINQAHDRGILVVAAMGNCRFTSDACPTANPIMYPAAMENVLAVSATDKYDNIAWYSQYGSHVDLAAPGGTMQWVNDSDGILSTMPYYDVYLTTYYKFENAYEFLQGTSQATAHVSGLAGLVWSLSPDLSPDQVQEIMQESAVDLGTVGWDADFGWGRIDALAAVIAAAPPLDSPDLYEIDNIDGDGNYTVHWSTVEGAEEYLLEQAQLLDFSDAAVAYLGTENQLEISDQQPGMWYYRVKAKSGLLSSNWSVIRSTGVLPAAPVIEPIDNPDSEDEYLVDWNSVTGAEGYILQESYTITFTVPVTRYIGTALSYQVTGQPGGDWYYRTRAFNLVGEGLWSDPIASTHVMTPVLEAPVLQPISNPDLNGEYLLSWTEVVSATSYLVEQDRSPYFVAPSEVYTGSLTSINIEDQSPGDWYYHVRAFDDQGGKSPWSASQGVVVRSWILLPVILQDEGG